MLKKIFTVIIISAFILSSYSFAAQDEQAELVTREKELSELSKKIDTLNQKIKQLKLEYIKAEKQLQREVAEKTCTLTEEEKELKSNQEIIRRARKKQDELRKDYYCKKRPLAGEMNKLKISHRECEHKIKKLEGKIKKIQEGKGPDYEYEEQMRPLKQELAGLKEELHATLSKLQNETDEKLAALTDKEHRTKARKQILSEAKEKELKLRQEYAKKKEIIVSEMDKAKAAYRQRLRQRRAEKRQEQRVGGGPSCNFGPASR